MAVRIVSRGLIGRAMASAAMAVVLLAAVAGRDTFEPPSRQATAASPSPTAAPAGSPIGTGPIASALSPVSADPGYADQIVALGLDEATAAFMARTLSTLEVWTRTPSRSITPSPTERRATRPITWSRAHRRSPGDPPTIVYEVVGDELRYQLRYAVDPADLPEDLRHRCSRACRSWPGRRQHDDPCRAPAGPGPADSHAGRLRGRDTEHRRGRGRRGHLAGPGDRHRIPGPSAERPRAGPRPPSHGRPSRPARRSGRPSRRTTSSHLRSTGSRPSASAPRTRRALLTQQQYREDPSEQQKVLDDLTEVENDIRASAAVMFTSMLTDTGSSLIKAAPWLGFIVGPANNYIKETNLGLIESRVRAAEQLVVPCQHSVRMAGGADHLAIDAVVCDSQALHGHRGSDHGPLHAEQRQSLGRRHLHVQRGPRGLQRRRAGHLQGEADRRRRLHRREGTWPVRPLAAPSPSRAREVRPDPRHLRLGPARISPTSLVHGGRRPVASGHRRRRCDATARSADRCARR